MHGSYYETSIPPTGTAKYLSADYRVWLPDNVPTVRGVLIKQHGCTDAAASIGLDHANDLQWQALALKHRLALLGTKYLVGERICDDWAVINNGSEAAFLQALHTFAQQSNHPELNHVPWVLWGHSGGADWGMQMMHKYPNRTIAVVAMRCGGALISGSSQFLASNPDPAIFGVPVLFAEAEHEMTDLAGECLELPKQIFSRYRKAGALWSLAVEANASHESGDTRFLAIPYLDAILTTRLTDSDTSLRSIQESQGWLGNLTTHEITPVAQYRGQTLEATWLPNEETAHKWQQYIAESTGNQIRHNLCRIGEKLSVFKLAEYLAEACNGSKILPTAKPAPPTSVRAVRSGKTEATLTWSFAPDLENGLPSFRIYRDDALIQTFQGQGHNFGDAPEPPQVVLEFRDQDAKGNAVYTISAFNVLGESMSQPTQLMGVQ